ncbi:MAG: hypothetical protein CM15mP55_3830 [Hyphomicrobiales bacterium]|nr:MAG: hypothetical protein CM15mP55_3830 [Hyphomicrobiales bacterium]
MGLADRARMQISAMGCGCPRLRQGAGVLVLAGLAARYWH